MTEPRRGLSQCGPAALLGAVTGVLGALGMMAGGGFGAAPGFALFGACVGLLAMGKCEGLDLALYVFPGLTFGLAFAGGFVWRGRLRMGEAVVFWAGTMMAHAVAITATLTAQNVVVAIGPGTISLAVSGAIGGALGGGMVAAMARHLLAIAHWRRLAAAGSLLGLLLPVIDTSAGLFVFYALWQAGYAATLTILLPNRDQRTA